MSEDVSLTLELAEDSMKKALSHLETELVKIRAGKANPQMLDGIMVDYYGSPTPINQIGNISVLDARTLTIQPWEKICCSLLSGLLLPPTLVSIRKMMVLSFDCFYHH